LESLFQSLIHYNLSLIFISINLSDRNCPTDQMETNDNQQQPTRAAALSAKPDLAVIPEHTLNVAEINALSAEDRVARIQAIINNVHASVLARARWATEHKDVLWLPDLEAVADELVGLNVVSRMRRIISNTQQDRNINALSDEIFMSNNLLNTIIRRKERNIHADAVAGMRAGGSGGGNGTNRDESGDRNGRNKPARDRLRPGTGISEMYTGPDGNINIRDFLMAAQDLFNAADEGAIEKLSAKDKIAHLKTLITGTAREVVRLEERNLRNGAYEFSADILERFDIPSTWRDVTVTHPIDFTDFLQFIFTSRSENDQKKTEYKAIVARGYFADPDTIRRQLQRAQIAVGTTRPDIAISPEQLLQDFLSMLPAEHCTKIYESPEYTRTGGVGITIDIAARVAQNYHRALMRTTSTGNQRSTRLAALLPSTDAAMMADTVPEMHGHNTQIAKLHDAVLALEERLTNQARMESTTTPRFAAAVNIDDVEEIRETDSVNVVAMAAVHNASLLSLAQRDYNAKRRQEMKESGSSKKLRTRCWSCGQLGHIQANCPSPQPRPGFTPFRRIRHRDRNPGFIGGARPVRFFRRDPNTHRLTALQDNEINTVENDYVYALELGDDDDQVFIVA
jgi:hypothetical protein